MPTLTYPHWRDVPATAWRWPNFSAAEIACRGTGAIKINTEAMDKLQSLRDRLGNVVLVGLRHLVVGSHPRVTTAALEWDRCALVESGPVARAGGGGVGALQDRRAIYNLRVLLAEAQHL